MDGPSSRLHGRCADGFADQGYAMSTRDACMILRPILQFTRSAFSRHHMTLCTTRVVIAA
jgi:hypothetical protein